MKLAREWGSPAVAGAVVALVAALAAGCTGQADPAPPTGQPTTAAPDGTQDAPIPTETANGSVIEIETTPGTADDGFVGARDDVTVDRCAADGDGWVAAGTVTNSQDADQHYRIYVALLDETETLGLREVVVDVAAGESERWEAELAVTGEDLRCILRVERVVS